MGLRNATPVSKHKYESGGSFSLAFPEPQPSGCRAKEEGQASGGSHHWASLPTSPKEPQEKKIYPSKKSLLWLPLSYSRKQNHKTNSWVIAKANLYLRKQE